MFTLCGDQVTLAPAWRGSSWSLALAAAEKGHICAAQGWRSAVRVALTPVHIGYRH